jgi:hypothetical protein
MNAVHIFEILAIGVGATILIDLWSIGLERAFAIRSLDYCLLGRWVLHMPSGRIAHASIRSAAAKRHECRVGWTTHYLIGVSFAAAFVSLMSAGWLAAPTLLPALAFGVATVIVPFFTVQPAFGLGVASSKTPKPNRARLKSLSTHTIFGIGLWVWGTILAGVV